MCDGWRYQVPLWPILQLSFQHFGSLQCIMIFIKSKLLKSPPSEIKRTNLSVAWWSPESKVPQPWSLFFQLPAVVVGFLSAPVRNGTPKDIGVKSIVFCGSANNGRERNILMQMVAKFSWLAKTSEYPLSFESHSLATPSIQNFHGTSSKCRSAINLSLSCWVKHKFSSQAMAALLQHLLQVDFLHQIGRKIGEV